jgi:hypothetical protein
MLRGSGIIAVLLLLFAASPLFADTYTGIVSGGKHFHNGGVAVDLDGRYPNEKMTLYVPPEDEEAVGKLPPIGSTVTATGAVIQYRGRPEIRIESAGQWKW